MIQLINNIKRGPLANALALHDFDFSRVNDRKWFGYVVDFFRKNGLEPTRMGLAGSPYKGQTTIKFSNGLKRLEENQYQEVQAISLYATPPNHSTDMFDGIFMLEYTKRNRGTLVLCWDDKIVFFNQDQFQEVLLNICPSLYPKYGYGFQRLFSQGPSFYPRGTISSEGNLDEEEERRITTWKYSYSMIDGNYKTGDLRDIYPLNILSQAHLDRMVNGHRFEEWISGNPQRGNLKKITDTLWTWWVEADQIPSVRQALAPSGIILCL